MENAKKAPSKRLIAKIVILVFFAVGLKILLQGIL